MPIVRARRWLRTRTSTIALLLTFALAGVFLGTSRPVAAANFTPACGDTAALIRAIEQANSNGQPDIIALQPGCTYTLNSAHNTTDEPNGLPAIQPDPGGGAPANLLTIEGHGATIARGDGSPAFRIFYVVAGARLALRDLTVVSGRALGGGALGNEGTADLLRVTFSGHSSPETATGELALSTESAGGTPIMGRGGAIFNGASATLTIRESRLVGNGVAGAGGAIYSLGALTVERSTITGNRAGNEGGGLFAAGSVTIGASTIDANEAQQGGGLFAAGGTWALTNVTVAGNTARSGKGGGLATAARSGSAVTVNNSTFAGNHAGSQAGSAGVASNIAAETQTSVTLSNTIVADPLPAGSPNCAGRIDSAGYNLQHPGTSCGRS
ncbi:MAG TPA: right-handed parallel beta-helix repeat-containing protein, partial [Roseiflexaceae bacterium]|nr:right-handed parallel beta-helix repeat-containing protein [Roseiflexaceae bacterium]